MKQAHRNLAYKWNRDLNDLGSRKSMVIGNIWQRLALPRLDFGAQDEVRRAKSQAWGNCVLQSAPAPTTAHCNQRHHVMTTNLEYQEG